MLKKTNCMLYATLQQQHQLQQQQQQQLQQHKQQDQHAIKIPMRSSNL